MTMEEAANRWTEIMDFAIRRGEAQTALLAAHRILDLSTIGYNDAVGGAKLCEGCDERVKARLVLETQHLKAYLEGKDPRPMCAGTPSAIRHLCPRCGTYTDRVETSRKYPLELRCSKCQEDPEKCPRCKGKGWTKGLTPGGSRVISAACSECNGTGKR